MDLLTVEEPPVETVARLRQWPAFAGLSLYVVVVAAAIAHHEPWADEAQSWLLARDAGLVELWTRLMHYEGSTGLWQTLLHVLIGLGLPYSGIGIVAGVLGIAASGLILWRAPFPLAIRIALPLTYFLCYQYAVIARSYDLLPVLVFACAAWFEQATERPMLFTLLLCLTAAVSVHGMILAASIGLAAAVRFRNWRRILPCAGGFTVAAALLIATAWPAADGVFVTRMNFSFDHFVDVCGNAFTAAFTGEIYSSLAIVALSIPLLWRGGGLLFFAVASGLLCGVYAIVYAQVWHFGVLFLAWIFALWIAFARLRRPRDGRRLSVRNLALAALAIVIAVQGYWTWCAVRYDWRETYSGSRSAAQALNELNLTGRKIYAIGFACVAIEPYLPRNIFANWNDGRAVAYWDWSKQNHTYQDALRLSKLRPDYVMVGYKSDEERDLVADKVLQSGYRKIRHFEGNTFWQDKVFEPESYDLYQAAGGR